MNKRIFKLALEAMDFQGAIDTDTELKLSNDELAKFAELIVKECAEMVDTDGDSVMALRMMKHFGVE